MAPFIRERSASSHMALSPGAIAGIAIAATIVIVLIFLCLISYLRQKSAKGKGPMDRENFYGIKPVEKLELDGPNFRIANSQQVLSRNSFKITTPPKSRQAMVGGDRHAIAAETTQEIKKDYNKFRRNAAVAGVAAAGETGGERVNDVQNSTIRTPQMVMRERGAREERRKHLQDAESGSSQRWNRRSSQAAHSWREDETDLGILPTTTQSAIGHYLYAEDAPVACGVDIDIGRSRYSSKSDLIDSPIERSYEPRARCFQIGRGTIDPWELEYEPNPVLFPHLVRTFTNTSRVEALGVGNGGGINVSDSPTLPNHETKYFRTVKNINGDCPITPPEQAMLSSHYDDKYGGWDLVEPTRNYDHLELSASLPIPSLGGEFESRDISKYAVEHSWEPSDKEKNVSEDTQHNLPTPSEISPESFPARTQNPPHACPACPLRFSTAGLRRDHFNRRHHRRYICTLCNAAFNLRSDLQRHEATVHKSKLHTKLSRTFTCPNVTCTTPRKEYARKDNFRRHVERCKKNCERAG